MKTICLIMVLIMGMILPMLAQATLTNTPTVGDYLFGPIGLNMFIASFLFAMIGVVISLLIDANYRDQNSPKTPRPFKLSFLLKDNWKRIVLSLLVILVTIRFTKEITGWDLNMFVSLLIGVVYDKLVEYLKKKSELLQVSRN